jgi:hypothetical protein
MTKEATPREVGLSESLGPPDATFDEWWKQNRDPEPCWRLRHEAAWIIYKAGVSRCAAAVCECAWRRMNLVELNRRSAT